MEDTLEVLESVNALKLLNRSSKPMDKMFLRFINGENNYYRTGNLSIGREPMGNGTDYYIIKFDDSERSCILFDFYTKSLGKRTPRYKRGTGGKEPYIMLLTNRLQESGLDAKKVGYLTMLAPYVEWGTGRLVTGRKKRQMLAPEIHEALGISHNTWNKAIKEFKEREIMTVTKDGYFISTELFKKGSNK